jgi:hypothetical protein
MQATGPAAIECDLLDHAKSVRQIAYTGCGATPLPDGGCSGAGTTPASNVLGLLGRQLVEASGELRSGTAMAGHATTVTPQADSFRRPVGNCGPIAREAFRNLNPTGPDRSLTWLWVFVCIYIAGRRGRILVASLIALTVRRR